MTINPPKDFKRASAGTATEFYKTKPLKGVDYFNQSEIGGATAPSDGQRNITAYSRSMYPSENNQSGRKRQRVTSMSMYSHQTAAKQRAYEIKNGKLMVNTGFSTKSNY